jgi:hypothetical protein
MTGTYFFGGMDSILGARTARVRERLSHTLFRALEARNEAHDAPAGGGSADAPARTPRARRTSARKPASGDDGGSDGEPSPDLALLVNTLIGRIAALSKPSIPIEHDLWSVTEIAAYFKRSESVVRERIVCVPSFPVAIRLPNERGQRMHALWPAADVIAWAHKHRERETA